MTFAPDVIPFATRLAHAVVWCEQRRTLPVDRADDLHWIASMRSHGVHGHSIDDALATAGKRSRGRLLVYYPDSDTADGGAQGASDGFFDMHAAPPWDTWIAIGGDDAAAGGISRTAVLLAWVPACFVSVADNGIWADPMGSIAWLDDAAPIAAAVRRELAA